MAAQELKPAYLVTGNDRPKVERTLARLRARFDPGSIERLVAGEGRRLGLTTSSPPATPARCSAGERLVLVTEVDGRRGDCDRLTGGWKAADVEAVVDYLRAPAPGTVLCLVGEEVKKDSPLAKAVREGRRRPHLGDREEGRHRLGGAELPRRGASRSGGDACKALLDIVGDDKLTSSLRRSTSSRRGPRVSRSASRRCSGMATPFAEGASVGPHGRLGQARHRRRRSRVVEGDVRAEPPPEGERGGGAQRPPRRARDEARRG